MHKILVARSLLASRAYSKIPIFITLNKQRNFTHRTLLFHRFPVQLHKLDHLRGRRMCFPQWRIWHFVYKKCLWYYQVRLVWCYCQCNSGFSLSLLSVLLVSQRHPGKTVGICTASSLLIYFLWSYIHGKALITINNN